MTSPASFDGTEPAQQVELPGIPQPGWNWRAVCSLAALVAVVETLALSYPLVPMAEPAITAHFDTTQAGWVMTSFLLVGAATAPLLGKLADLHGKRRILLSCLALSAAGALMSALAPSFAMLLAGRCLFGLLVPCLFLSYSLVRDVFPPRTIALAVSIVTSAVGLAAIPAPYLTERLLDDHGYRTVFGFFFLVTALAAVAVAVTTRESTVRLPVRVGVRGAALLGLGLVIVLVGVSQGPAWGWVTPSTLACLGAGVALIVAWLATAARTGDAMIDIRLWRRRPVLLTVLAAGCVYAATGLYAMVLPMLIRTPAMLGLGYGFGVTPKGVAEYLVPIGLLSVVGGIAVGVLAGRRLIRPGLLLALGMLSTALGSVLTAYSHDSKDLLLLFAGLVGLGAGLAYAATPNLLIAAVPPGVQASTAALVSVCQIVIPAIAPIIAFSIMNGSHVAQLPPMITRMLNGAVVYTEGGLKIGFLIAAAIALAGLLFALLLPRTIEQVSIGAIAPEAAAPEPATPESAAAGAATPEPAAVEPATPEPAG
ncbi:MFS transporter [Nocardia sp. NPDC004278]|uniref:MFS transporter n=1 Tax=Nocardia sp. NPDC004604 TaxID=3157013 RepID=UPI0033ABF72F